MAPSALSRSPGRCGSQRPTRTQVCSGASGAERGLRAAAALGTLLGSGHGVVTHGTAGALTTKALNRGWELSILPRSAASGSKCREVTS